MKERQDKGRPPQGDRSNSTSSSAYNARLGIMLFIIYALVYAGFVGINALRPKMMGLHLAGVNLAVVYGMFLIVLAVVLAIVYNSLCARVEDREDDR